MGSQFLSQIFVVTVYRRQKPSIADRQKFVYRRRQKFPAKPLTLGTFSTLWILWIIFVVTVYRRQDSVYRRRQTVYRRQNTS